MAKFKPGEVWQVDLGLAAKIRPCLILSDYPRDNELALVEIVPHTTAVRGNRWELSIPKAFLKPGAFHLQQIQSISLARLEVGQTALSSAHAESGIIGGQAKIRLPTLLG